MATDYHINETPMIEQDGHFKHLSENPTYIRPEDWRDVDELVDWMIEKNKAGYQMVNSVQRLQEMKAFMRMSSGVDLRQIGWYGDGTGDQWRGDKLLATMPGIVREPNGELALHGLELPRGPEQRHHSHRRHRGPVLPDVWRRPTTGAISTSRSSNRDKSTQMKQTCQHHCFSTLNHNLAYCYNDARVIKWLWQQDATGLQGGAARSFED